MRQGAARGDIVPQGQRASLLLLGKILGDIRQVQEVAEGPRDHVCLVLLQFTRALLKDLAILVAALASQSHRRAPQCLDRIVSGLALGLADDVAEHAPEQSDFFAVGLDQCVSVIHGGRRDRGGGAYEG